MGLHGLLRATALPFLQDWEVRNDLTILLLTVASNITTKNSVTIKYVYIYLLEFN
jgi:hypothetical protein